jgi:hypothetical protein
MTSERSEIAYRAETRAMEKELRRRLGPDDSLLGEGPRGMLWWQAASWALDAVDEREGER